MSETIATPPGSPITKKEDEIKKATATGNVSNTKKFEGDGLPFKAKLIGMEDLTVDRDEKICLDSMLKLKAVVSLRGEHKQRIQLNLTMSTVKITDEATKAQIACHEIERISFVVIDPRDTRAFGYIYNTSDDRHQFWAIKTERAAAATVLALKELFELAFEQYTTAEKGKDDTSKVTQTSPAPVNLIQESSQAPPPAAVSTLVSPGAASILEDPLIWGDTPAPASQPLFDSNIGLFDTNPIVTSYTPQQPNSNNPLSGLEDIAFTSSPPPPPPNQTAGLPTNTNDLSGLFFNPVAQPQPQPTNPYASFHNSSIQPTPPSTLPPFIQQQQQQQQQRPLTPTNIAFQPLQPQQNIMTPSPISPTPTQPAPPPPVTSPFAGLDSLGGANFSPKAKTTKESFFPTAAPKSIQQLKTEKQT